MPSRHLASHVAIACLGFAAACSASTDVDEHSSVGSSTPSAPSASGSTSPSQPPAVDVRSLGERAQPLAAAVQPDRAFADITTLARSPRHAEQNPDAARAATAYIRSELEEAGLEVREIPVTSGDATLPVVWAEIGGKRCGDKVFVLTGHYDTVPGSPGADDDASGVAAVLETARVLAKAEPDASIVVAGLPFEEQGPPYPAARALGGALQKDGRTIVGMVSAEMLGYAAPAAKGDDPGDTLMLLGYEGAEGLVQTFRAAASAWTSPVKGWGGVEAGTYPPDTSFISRSDHMAFHALGVPAAFATDGANFRTPHYHQASDTPENIVKPFFEGAVRTMVGGTFAMSSLDADGDGQAEACVGKQPI